MAHNIATINGREAMTFTGETPWHRLGTQLDAPPTLDEALRAASLDWEVFDVPICLQNGEPVEGHKAIIRRELERAVVLGVVTDDYEPIQQREAFGILGDAIESAGVTIETAGALGQGEVVWMLAKLPERKTIIAAGGPDSIDSYFLISNAHDGSRAYRARTTPIRVVCQNTLNAAFSTGARAEIAITHFRGATARLDDAKRLVEAVATEFDGAAALYQRMASAELALDQAEAYFTHVLPDRTSPEQRAALLADAGMTKAARTQAVEQLRMDRDRLLMLDRFRIGIGHELAGPTVWGAYNAVAEIVDHGMRYDTVRARKSSAASAVFGPGAVLKSRAFKLAAELVD